MIRAFWAALSIAAAMACAGQASALTYGYTGQIDSFTAAVDGTYQINAWGAQGGTWPAINNTGVGGLGAMVGGSIYLHAGDSLSLVVGGVGGGGGNLGMGGGGASWVYFSSDLDLLLAAGGGGGAGWICCAGGAGLAGPDGGGTGGGVAAIGGIGGGGANGGGGAGWLGVGGGTGNLAFYPSGTGGSALPSFQGGRTVGCVDHGVYDECYDGVTGGFGGGGGAGWDGGGGGGGYSGGAGGSGNNGVSGGGGSYIAESFYNSSAQAGVRSGNGLITINFLGVPEPSTWAMLILGFMGVGASLRRRRAALIGADHA